MVNDRIGEIRKSNNCGLMKIVEYNGVRDITIKFKTGSVVKTRYDHFKRGTVKDPLFPSVFGIGYLGIGKFKAKINNKNTTEYQTWYNMLQRCYDPYIINKKLTYQDATVSEIWKNFQNFAEWHKKNYYDLFDEDVHLDKDIIKKGNKVYCPEFCAFVPQSINALLTKSDKARGKYPIGVSFNKHNKKYKSYMLINGKQKHLGYFSTSIEAFNSYKIAKEEQIQVVANKYKNILKAKVFDSLMNYKVFITD